MKKEWESEPLGELCDILDSMRKPVTKKDRVAGEIPYYGATGIQDYVADYLFDEPLVLVGEDGAKWGAGENSAFAVTGKCWVNNHAHVLRPHRKTVVDNWLIYYLNATDLSGYVSGLTVPKLNQGNLRQIPIPVPPLAEQRRIVAILDEALEGIAAVKANAIAKKAALRETKQAVVHRAFTNSLQVDEVAAAKNQWQEKLLGDLCDVLDSMRKPVTKKDRVAGDIPYYGATGIQDYVADYLFDEPLVLVGEDGAKWGAGDRTAFGVSGKCWVNNHAHVLRPDRHQVVDQWLIYYLNATDLSQYVSGLTVPKLNQGNLRQIPIPVPPIPDQLRIVAIVDEAFEGIAKLDTSNDAALAALDELKASLLHQTFTGQL